VNKDVLIETLFQSLISGDRVVCRQLVNETVEAGMSAEELVTDVFWPVYELTERLHRSDQITRMAHHLSTRLLRSFVDQAATRYTQHAPCGRDVFALCGPTDADELAAQITVDLLESRGYGVTFAGGGIAYDEVIAQLGDAQPDVLLLFASAPSDLPGIRYMIDKLREIGTCGDLQIVVGGGVFTRADGLAEEIGADLWANDPVAMLKAMAEAPDRRATAEQRTVGLRRKRSEAA
jgi:methanogenic corrinoid protein MtbC1